MADTCPQCGAVRPPVVSDFDDEPTPVDPRVEARDVANVTLLENEVARHRLETERLAAEVKALQIENAKLKVRLRGMVDR